MKVRPTRHLLLAFSVTLATVDLAAAQAVPPPPRPEQISIRELPLPPTAPSDAVGSCTSAINPSGTGCMGASPRDIQSGSFLPDGRNVLLTLRYAGAAAGKDPASIYAGTQLLLIKVDGTHFSSGDLWKCLTCGVPPANARGISDTHDYPQSFPDGKRALAGTNIIDCSPYRLADDRCIAAKIHIYPIRWNVKPDNAGNGGSMRELRIHPDGVHLGFNGLSGGGKLLSQFGYIGRLVFNPSPKTGEPLVPRYDLVDVNRLFQPGLDKRLLTVDPANKERLAINRNAVEIGELRGFTKNGKEVIYIGYPWEASNVDVFAADLVTGKVRRLTSNPEYTDPVDSSPDDKWIIAMDTRGSGRMMFFSAMRGVPPITDLVTTSTVASVRNNGQRRFFQPYLIDRYGDRGTYQGQRLNAGDGRPGTPSDPNWNGMADPRWSPDGTSVVYWQALVTSPACGGANPLVCPRSTEPGGRRSRLMIARFTSRRPEVYLTPAPISDDVPWGTRYNAGDPFPIRAVIPSGDYILNGNKSGEALVHIADNAAKTGIAALSIRYENYSDDGRNFLDGDESVSKVTVGRLTSRLSWSAHVVQHGGVTGLKATSPGGFSLELNLLDPIFESTGSLITTINGIVYKQPENGT